MPAPIIPLQVVQQGVETTRGTAVAATAALDFEPGSATLQIETEQLFVRRAGSLATAHRAYAVRQTGSVRLRQPVTYQWLPTWLNLFLGPRTSGTGAGADKTWTFDSTVVSDSADNLRSLTLEVGGRDTWPGEFRLAGCMGKRLTLDIVQNAVWMADVELIGGTLTQAAKTAAINPLSGLVDILGATTKVYVNSAASAFGTTQRAGIVVSGQVTIEVGTDRRWTLDSSVTPSRLGVFGPRVVSAQLVVEFDAIGDFTALQAASAQRVRIESVGPTLGSSAYKATLDLPGVWEALEFGEDNGVVTATLRLHGMYDTGPAADIAAVVVNDRAALP
jgi:hypothetical protein